MLLRIITFILGIIFTIIGIVMIEVYLNVLVNGYTLFEYVKFIIKRFECWLLVLGIVFLYLSIFIRRKNEIHI